MSADSVQVECLGGDSHRPAPANLSALTAERHDIITHDAFEDGRARSRSPNARIVVIARGVVGGQPDVDPTRR
jgi:hypothetical protein